MSRRLILASLFASAVVLGSSIGPAQSGSYASWSWPNAPYSNDVYVYVTEAPYVVVWPWATVTLTSLGQPIIQPYALTCRPTHETVPLRSESGEMQQITVHRC